MYTKAGKIKKKIKKKRKKKIKKKRKIKIKKKRKKRIKRIKRKIKISIATVYDRIRTLPIRRIIRR